MPYNYPLHLRFKLIALAPRVFVTDSTGQQVAYVHQKTFKFKEDVRIYSDESKSREIFRINADRVIDFSARYHFTDSTSERKLGSIKHKGFRSIWRSTYLVSDETEAVTHHIKEDNPWVKVADAVLNELPFVGLFTGYLFHPSYTAYRGDDTQDLSQPVMRLDKQPSFFERQYTVDKLADISPAEEQRIFLSFMMMIQLERSRG